MEKNIVKLGNPVLQKLEKTFKNWKPQFLKSEKNELKSYMFMINTIREY